MGNKETELKKAKGILEKRKTNKELPHQAVSLNVANNLF